MNKNTQVTAQITPAYEKPSDISQITEVPVYVLNELLRTYKSVTIHSHWENQKVRLEYQVSQIHSNDGLKLFKEGLMAESYIQQTLHELENIRP